jgi:pimeloyl-ACP methyl ester carboxylesterase
MINRHRDVDGVRMHWQECGEGLPVVMVHGLCTSPLLWRHVAPRIVGARCLAWEMVGYGNSINYASTPAISIAQQATYLLAWLRALHVKSAILVGHDLGGGVVQIAAKEQPDICAGLVLVNSVGYDAWPSTTVKAARRLSVLVKRLPKPIFKLAFRRFLLIGHTNRTDAAEAFALYWPQYAANGVGAFVRQARSLHLRDTRNLVIALQRLNVPKRIIWGARDRILPVRYGFRFAHDLDADFQYIFKGRHFTPEDHPDVVAEAVNDVLAQLAGGGYPRDAEPRHLYG